MSEDFEKWSKTLDQKAEEMQREVNMRLAELVLSREEVEPLAVAAISLGSPIQEEARYGY